MAVEIDHLRFMKKKWVDSDSLTNTNNKTLKDIQIQYARIASANLYFDKDGKLQYNAQGTQSQTGGVLRLPKPLVLPALRKAVA